MRTLESSGKSIDEAIFKGLEEMGISIDEVEIEIIQQETRGILGLGAKRAVVRLTEREPEDIVLPGYMQKAKDPRETREPRELRRPREDRPRSAPRPTVQATQDAEASDAGNTAATPSMHTESGAPAANRAPRQQNRNRRNGGREREERLLPQKPGIEYSAEAAKDNATAEFLDGMLSRMGVEAEVLANIQPAENGEPASIRLCINSKTMGILIGRRGETLDALQYLCSLCANRDRKESGYTRVTIDTENYRDRREETLIRLARKVASQVKATGRSRSLEPMNPYERRVLHEALQNNPYVTTYSEGEEPNRYVVVEPKK